jgi:hypothetical protein
MMGANGEWVRKILPEQRLEHLTYSTRLAAEQALMFLPSRRYRLEVRGLPVTVH